MNPGDSINAILKAAAGVTDLVGTGTAARIYPGASPQQKSFPLCVYSIVGSTPHNTKDGASQMEKVVVNVDAWDETQGGAQDLGDAIQTALDQYTGTIASTLVKKIIYQSRRVWFDEESKLHRVNGEYNVYIMN